MLREFLITYNYLANIFSLVYALRNILGSKQVGLLLVWKELRTRLHNRSRLLWSFLLGHYCNCAYLDNPKIITPSYFVYAYNVFIVL